MCMGDLGPHLPSFFPREPRVCLCPVTTQLPKLPCSWREHVSQPWPLRCTQTSAGRSLYRKGHSVLSPTAFLLGARM